MDYLPTLGENQPQSMGNVGKDTLHGASGIVQELRNNELPKLLGISSNLLVFVETFLIFALMWGNDPI